MAPQKKHKKSRKRIMYFPVIKKNYILRRREISGSIKIALYNIYDKKVIELNEDALYCIKSFSGQYSVEEIANRIANKFNIKRETALLSVNKVVDELVAHDVIYMKNERGEEHKFSSLPKMSDILNHVYILLTRDCNLRCIHCSVDAGFKSKEELTKKEVFDLIDQINDMMVPSLTISGGEPTLVEYLPDLIEYAAKKPLKVHLMTNGFAVDRYLAELMVRSGLVHVNVSLDGAEADAHDYLRGVRGSFRRALNAIKIFKELGIYVETTTVIYEKNCNDIKEIINLGKRLRLDNMKFVPIVPQKRGKKCDFFRSFDCYVSNIGKFLFAYDTIYNKLVKRDLREKLLHNETIYRCGAGTGVISITPEGDVIPCNNIDNIVMGNIRNQKLIQIYNGSKNLKNVDEILSIKGSDCEQCDILDYCRGGCTASAYSYSGDFKKCDITRKPLIIELLKKNGETVL